MTASAHEYRGDADDPSYDGWSYLGDRYRCPPVDQGHRCAFVRLMQLFMAAERVGDLRAMALAGNADADERHRQEADSTLRSWAGRGGFQS